MHNQVESLGMHDDKHGNRLEKADTQLIASQIIKVLILEILLVKSIGEEHVALSTTKN